MRVTAWGTILLCQLLISVWAAGQESRTVTCTFADGNEMSVRYTIPESKKSDPPYGKVWTPADQPMVLFAQTALTANHVSIPVGAYSLFIIPERKHWTAIVNRNVESSAKYDAQQDLVRVPMDIGELPQRTDPAEISLGHIAPQECNLRIDFGKVGAWAEFTEKQ